MKMIRSLTLAGTALMIAALGVSAQEGGLQKDLATDIRAVGEKFVGLAEAMPQDAYDWRPGDGVRSVAEVFTHIAMANYGLPGMMGLEAGDMMMSAEEFQAQTDKDQIVAHLQRAFDHLASQVESVPDGRLDESLSYFGMQGTVRSFMLLLATHCHEHLGQSIAYARVNGVTPPWSM